MRRSIGNRVKNNDAVRRREKDTQKTDDDKSDSSKGNSASQTLNSIPFVTVFWGAIFKKGRSML